MSRKTRTVKDHLGNSYSSIKAMCDAYGISTSTYYLRMNMKGCSVKEALTNPVAPYRQSRGEVYDHKGNVYPSKLKMCEAYGITCSTFASRVRKGWSVEKALTEPLQLSKNIECEDHEGKAYSSKKEMCEAWGITYQLYNSRRNAGWSLEKILTTPYK